MSRVLPDPLSREVIVDAIAHLVRVPSVNPSLAPDEGHGEAAVASAACDWLARHGVPGWLEEVAPGRVNAVAQVGNGEGPTLVLCAHLDTVGTRDMTIPPFEPVVRDGRLFGRGSYDMKGSAGAIMAAMVALSRRGLNGHAVAALVCDEEHASLGASDFVHRHAADACILTEPSEERLILGHKGFVWLEVVATGRAAHGSRWELGESAIGRMARIVTAFETFDRDILRARQHPLVGPASMHCALIEGGTGLSIYAPECRLKIERRTIPGEMPDDVVREIQGVIASAGETAEVKRFFDRSPLVCDRDHAVVGCLRDAVTTVTGREPEEAGVAYWMDAAIFAEAGIPTVNYGPAGEGAHAAVEWVDVESAVRCARVLPEAVVRFCEGDRVTAPPAAQG